MNFQRPLFRNNVKHFCYIELRDKMYVFDVDLNKFLMCRQFKFKINIRQDIILRLVLHRPRIFVHLQLHNP